MIVLPLDQAEELFTGDEPEAAGLLSLIRDLALGVLGQQPEAPGGVSPDPLQVRLDRMHPLVPQVVDPAGALRLLRDTLKAEDPSLEVNDLEADGYVPGELLTLASPSLLNDPRLIRVENVEKLTDAFLSETLSYLEQRDLRLRDGVAEGNARPLTVRADAAGWFTLGTAVLEPLKAFDVLLMRKERSRAGSGVILRTARQSVCPLRPRDAGIDSVVRTASAVTVPRNSNCVRVTGRLRGVRACI